MMHRTTAPWGLSRLSQDGRVSGSVSARTFRYSYDDSAGKGVDIYILGMFLSRLNALSPISLTSQILVSVPHT